MIINIFELRFYVNSPFNFLAILWILWLLIPPGHRSKLTIIRFPLNQFPIYQTSYRQTVFYNKLNFCCVYGDKTFNFKKFKRSDKLPKYTCVKIIKYKIENSVKNSIFWRNNYDFGSEKGKRKTHKF